MLVEAHVQNRPLEHEVLLRTDGRSHSITIAPKESGSGSSANGGELLVLAIATCYCNDLYREAASLDIQLRSVEVTARATFGGPGEPASRISYSARVESDAPADVIQQLLAHTDRVAEVHNTLRAGIAVTFEPAGATGSTSDVTS